MIEAPGYERAIALEDDPALPGCLDNLPVVDERTPPDLVDRRRHSRLLGQLIDLADRVVAHTNGARETVSLRLDERPPRGDPRTATRRPMHQPEVDIIGPQRPQAAPQRLQLIPAGATLRHLRGDKDLIAIEPAGGDR